MIVSVPPSSQEEILARDHEEIPVDIVGHTAGTGEDILKDISDEKWENIDLSCNETLDEFIAETIGVKLNKEQKADQATE